MDSLMLNGNEYAVLGLLGKWNIDWFPTNFMCRDGVLYYVDYECDPYMDQWSFESWGVRYWSRTPELDAYAREHGDG